MRPIAIRAARPDELAAVGDLVVRAYQHLDEPVGPGYLAVVRDAVGRSRHCPILVAVDDDTGALLGSVTYVPDHENPFAELERPGEAGFRMLGVAPEAERHGVGAALVSACIARARADGKSGIAIVTSPSMRAAQRLYARLGFVRAPDRDFVPVPGVTLWAFVLAL